MYTVDRGIYGIYVWMLMGFPEKIITMEDTVLSVSISISTSISTCLSISISISIDTVDLRIYILKGNEREYYLQVLVNASIFFKSIVGSICGEYILHWLWWWI